MSGELSTRILHIFGCHVYAEILRSISKDDKFLGFNSVCVTGALHRNNFLRLQFRLLITSCVEEHDKPVAMGFGITFHALFAFIPGPIFFGWILDRACIVWGKTCSGNGNCWLYDGEYLRYMVGPLRCAISVLHNTFLRNF